MLYSSVFLDVSSMNTDFPTIDLIFRNYIYSSVFLDVSSRNTDFPTIDLIFRNDILPFNFMAWCYIANRNPKFTLSNISQACRYQNNNIFIQRCKVQWFHTLIVHILHRQKTFNWKKNKHFAILQWNFKHQGQFQTATTLYIYYVEDKIFMVVFSILIHLFRYFRPHLY